MNVAASLLTTLGWISARRAFTGASSESLRANFSEWRAKVFAPVDGRTLGKRQTAGQVTCESDLGRGALLNIALGASMFDEVSCDVRETP